MQALIVESEAALGQLWQRHMLRLGVKADLATRQDDALCALERTDYDVMVLDLVLKNGAALALSDFASYRYPDMQVIFVTNSGFFSDGSIFNHCANACALVPTATAPDDLAAMVEHYGGLRKAG